MRYHKITTWFLAVSMFLFGVLKFTDPFKGWYSVQVAESELGQLSYSMGIAGEIVVGVILLVCLTYRRRIAAKSYILLTNASFFIIMIMMATGVYVHLHPAVPAEVLPLKIKPPYIPVFFLLLAGSNCYLSLQQIKSRT